MKKLGMIVRMDEGGLGNQTRNLAYMLKPFKLMVIDSSSFRDGCKQHPEWYEAFDNKIVVNGFPNSSEKKKFLEGIDAFITCEIPYGYDLISEANSKGIESYIQYNYEFLDYLQNKNLPKPTALIAPSEWNINRASESTDLDIKVLRPPLFLQQFHESVLANTKRTGGPVKLLHIVGRQAIHDRNGTTDLIAAVAKSKSSFHLTIKSQGPLDYIVSDPRITFDYHSPSNNAELYSGYDAMILPRRYGGLCLPMNEALASSIPVIMTDVSPNNQILPKNWLVKAWKVNSFMTRTMIDIYETDTQALADKIDWIANMSPEDLSNMKNEAFAIAYDEFNSDYLKDKYIEKLGL